MVQAEFRRRARENEDVGEILERFLDVLDRFPELWKDPGRRARVRLDRGTGESAACDLTPFLVPEIQGALSFASRLHGSIRDAAICDDSITLRFLTNAYDFRPFLSHVFPTICNAFACYRGSFVTDIDLALDDFAELVEDDSKTEEEKDDRFVVSRFYPVNFFDDLMCKRAFRVSAKELVKRLKPMCKRAELIDSGAFLIFTHEILTGDDLRALDAKARGLLVGS